MSSEGRWPDRGGPKAGVVVQGCGVPSGRRRCLRPPIFSFMTPKETGIVQLEVLPQDKIYLGLTLPFFTLLNEKIRKVGIFELARQLQVSKRIVNHWLSESSLVRLDILVRICAYFKIDYTNHILYLRGKNGGKIYNPRLPFDFTSETGVRFIASILGDGGISHKRKTCTYSNTNKDLTNGFLHDSRYIFGDVAYTTWSTQKKSSTISNISLPQMLSQVLFLIGLKAGKKVEINPNIPEFIFALPDEHKYTFLSQFIDDEGSVNDAGRHISLTSACLKKYGTPHLLGDIQKLILPLDILCSIYPGEVYLSKRGEPRRTWKLQIGGSIQLNKLHRHLNLRSSKKRGKLRRIINSYQLTIFRKRDILETYITIMERIQNAQGYFTSQDLAKETRRAVGSCTNTITKYKELGIIACVQPSVLTSKGSQFGRYILDPLV